MGASTAGTGAKWRLEAPLATTRAPMTIRMTGQLLRTRRRSRPPQSKPLPAPGGHHDAPSRAEALAVAKQRLQKVLARAGVASRRGAEELISLGRVRVA